MKAKHSNRGFTLVELSVVTAALAFFSALAGAYIHHTHERRQAAEGYASDLRAVRAALECLEEDLRAARSIPLEPAPGKLAIDGGEILYQCTDDGLVRSASGQWRSWGAIEGLELDRTGDLVRVALVLRRRCRPATVPPVTLHTAVHLRREAP